MLERIIIKGFQKWRNLVLDFTDPITVLWGATDKGKSAILRALRFVCLNQKPSNHINWSCKRASVTLFVDGHKVKRVQGKGKNTYSLDGKVLKSFNRGVPDQIKSLLNIESINFQRQHEAHFWLSLPPIQVSKELNLIVDLSIIDNSLAEVLSRIRSKQSEIKISKERLDTARSVRDELRWVAGAAEDLREIKVKQTASTLLQEQEAKLTFLLDNVTNHQSSLEKLLKLTAEGQELLSKAVQQQELHNKLGKLENIRITYEQLIEIRKIQIPKTDCCQKLIKLEQLVGTIKQQETILWQTQEELTKESKRLEQLRKKLKNCPVCLRPM